MNNVAVVWKMKWIAVFYWIWECGNCIWTMLRFGALPFL